MNPTSPTLESYVARLVEEKGLGGLDPEVHAQVEKDLLDRAEDRVNATIVANLPPEKLEEFDKLLDKGDEAAIQNFAEANIPHLDQLIATELLQFRDRYLNG